MYEIVLTSPCGARKKACGNSKGFYKNYELARIQAAFFAKNMNFCDPPTSAFSWYPTIEKAKK